MLVQEARISGGAPSGTTPPILFDEAAIPVRRTRSTSAAFVASLHAAQ
jgi:hypothetical protein